MAELRDGQQQVHPGNMKGITTEKTIEERCIIVGGELGQGNLDDGG